MLKLVTISRISKEKGFERMLQLEGLLAASGIAFMWDCYGDLKTDYAKLVVPKFKHVNFKGVTTEPKAAMKQYDYLVQLSDTEGFPYSIYEAMQMKVPVIATDFPSIHEMIKEGKNGYILKQDLSNFHPGRIAKVPVIKSFREKSNQSTWIKFLDMSTQKNEQKGAGTKQPAKIVVVKVIGAYHDTELGREFKPEDIVSMTEERAKQVVAAGFAEIIEPAAPVWPEHLQAGEWKEFQEANKEALEEIYQKTGWTVGLHFSDDGKLLSVAPLKRIESLSV